MRQSTPDQTQTEKLSLRMSAALSNKIEKARQIISETIGRNVSTSEVAKQLLEAAREERMETVELLSKPTESLLAIRRKKESGYPLSRAEWTAVAYYAQQGAECSTTNGVSCASLMGIIEAFAAAYELRIGTSHRDHYYVTHLPQECRREHNRPASPDIVRETVAETLRHLRESPCKPGPVFAARNLYVLLDGDQLPGAAVLDEVLSPFWPVLWRVAARGHYFVNRSPIRDAACMRVSAYQTSIPSVTENGYTLFAMRGEGNEFSLYLSFPGPWHTWYPIGGYPLIAEFRGMLAAIDPQATLPQRWQGQSFAGYARQRDDEVDFGFHAHANGIAFRFPDEDWRALRELFRRAWQLPEIQTVWDELTLEYGEW